MRPKMKPKLVEGKVWNEIDHLKFMNDMNRQFLHLKEAPIDEYLSRICDISRQLKEK